jgi:hypothetical protein
MIFPRRMATSAALVVLLSSLTTAPFAYAANCDAGFVGPYGTSCGSDEEQPPVVLTVKPPSSNQRITVTVKPFTYASNVLNIASDPNSTRTAPAVKLGDVIFNGVSNKHATKQDVTPVPGRKTVVNAIPGNPIKVTVQGFRKNATTTVEIKVQVSGDEERTRLGFAAPSRLGTITTPAVTVKQGDSATFFLNEWESLAQGGIDWSAGLVSQSVVSVSGSGVSKTPVRQLTGR